MQNFFDWFKNTELQKKPWLIIGKGPSYSKINDYDTRSFSKASLNHVIREQKVDLAHMIDFDVALECADKIYEHAAFLVMPWIPHVKNAPGTKTLEALLAEHPALRKLQDEGRVKFYNFGTAAIHKKGSPVVPACFFSSEAVVSLLTANGVKKIRTIGVDGGNQYSEKFNDLKDRTLLNNGHPSYDVQFRSIALKIMKDNLDYAPLDVPSPVKVYVGSMHEQMIAVKVLEYSIKKHASLPVEVKPLFQGGVNVPMPKDSKNKPRTPFSFQRFIIPQLNGYKSRAIYVDSDMQVFTDIKDLWARDMGEAEILSAWESSGTGRKPQFSVMLIDCEKLKWDIKAIVQKLDSGELTYEQLMYEMKVAKKIDPVIEAQWNSLEKFEEGSTKLLHYTDMGKQPWLFTVNPLTKIWVQELHEALSKGFLSWQEFKQHILEGNIRPSLWIQVRKKRFDPAKIRKVLARADRFFVAPHQLKPTTSKLKLTLNKLVARALITLV